MDEHPYHKLIVWKEAYRFVKDVYAVTRTFPSEEKFGVTSQLRRAATSIILNIAEGQGKRSPKDFQRFCDIANGSVRECAVLLELSRDLGYLNGVQYDQFDKQLRQTGSLLSRLMAYIETIAR